MKANYNRVKMTKADRHKLMSIVGEYLTDKDLGLPTPNYMGVVEGKPTTNSIEKEETSNENKYES